jgi:hypothetical protein
MSAIGWLELGEYDKAHRLLMKNMKYIQQPFQVRGAPYSPPQIIACLQGQLHSTKIAHRSDVQQKNS